MQNKDSIEKIKTGLLSNLDSENNVVNIDGALASIKLLEEFPMTRELLERTRIGKHVNELRKKTTNKELARRAKDLVKKWQSHINLIGSSQPIKKDDSSGKIQNGLHSLVSHTPSPTLPTCSDASTSKRSLNGKNLPSENKLVKNISTNLGKSAPQTPTSKTFLSTTSSPALTDLVSQNKNATNNIKNNINRNNNNGKINNNSSLNNTDVVAPVKYSKDCLPVVNSFHPKNNSNVTRPPVKIDTTKQTASNNNLDKHATDNNIAKHTLSNVTKSAINDIKNNISPKLPIPASSSSLSPSIPNNSATRPVINGVAKSSLKRRLDVPFADVDNTNPKKIKIDIDNKPYQQYNRLDQQINKFDKQQCKKSDQQLNRVEQQQQCNIKIVLQQQKSEQPHNKSEQQPQYNNKSEQQPKLEQQLNKSEQQSQFNNKSDQLNNRLEQQHKPAQPHHKSELPQCKNKSEQQHNRQEQQYKPEQQQQFNNKPEQQRNKLEQHYNKPEQQDNKSDQLPQFNSNSEQQDNKSDQQNDRLAQKHSHISDDQQLCDDNNRLQSSTGNASESQMEGIDDDDIEDLNRRLNRVFSQRWPGVNGQYDYNNEWQPWTKTYSMKSYNNDYLHILPYVSLDF